ncbi:MAG: peptidylprolyl isomerase [Novosphingobium sp.]
MAIALSGAAVAQDDFDGGLALPDNPQIFGKQDPNHRTAMVIINGEVITGTDVDQRVALVVAANGGKVAPEEMERLRMQVLRNLMDETLQIQEAKAQDMAVEDAEVEESYARIARQNFGQDPKAMDAYLAKIGSSPASLKRQIRGELAWQRLLRRNVTPFVNVSDDEVREAITRMEQAKGTDEYRVGEIFLYATSENRDAVAQNALKIVEQIKGGGNFVAYARQFSEASTAPVGGDLGWVKLGMLPPELQQAVAGLEPGQMVGPVEVRGGFSIVLLIDKRKVLTADPRDAVLSLKQVSIKFPTGTTEAQANQKAGIFAEAMAGAKGCAAADGIAQQIGAEVITNDQVKARDLPGPLQNMVLSLNVGQATPPFGSLTEGVSVLMLCGRDDPSVAGGPSFEDVENQILDERINRRSRAYMRDLRRDAVIDYGN